jgi:hypothetical protein
MNANEAPQGGPGEMSPTPVAVQQTTVIQVGAHKSVAGAVLLALFFGPIGMIYATVPGAIVMFFINIIVAIPTLGLGLFVTVPIGALWAGLAASSQNKRLQAVSAYQVTTPQAAPSPAPPAPPATTPAGPPTPSPPPLAPPRGAPEAATDVMGQEDEEVAVVLKSTSPVKPSCESCGHEVNPQARFCSACGAAQTAA